MGPQENVGLRGSCPSGPSKKRKGKKREQNLLNDMFSTLTNQLPNNAN